MSKLSFQNWANNINESLPNILKFKPSYLGSKFCPIQNKPLNNSQRLLKVRQSSEISPNLVALVEEELQGLDDDD